MYTRDSLRAEIARIYRKDPQFIWTKAADDATAAAKKGSLSADQVAAIGEQQKSTTLDQLTDYCWTAYDKARRATGIQVIGRIADLNQTLKAKVANLVPGDTLFTSTAHGNILQMDKWCVVVNDCWVLGGVQRAATFVLMSTPNWKNAWDPSIGGFVVTVREMLGLREFGYHQTSGRSLGPGSQGVATYVCRDTAKAEAADLESYQLAVALRESRGAIAAVNVINTLGDDKAFLTM